MSIDNQLVQYFDEWEQSLPPDARAALRPLFDQARASQKVNVYPETPLEVVDFIGVDFVRRHDAEDLLDVRYELTVHDLLTAFRMQRIAQPGHYTCIDKGGLYERLGNATGAGTRRGDRVVVYRSVSAGEMYFRDPADFQERMGQIDIGRRQG